METMRFARDLREMHLEKREPQARPENRAFAAERVIK